MVLDYCCKVRILVGYKLHFMEAYAEALNYAIPFFFTLILIEFLAGLAMGVKTIRSMDTISSLSSGMSNTIKDVLKLTVVIISYSFLYKHLAVFEIKTTWILVVLAFIGKDFAGYWTHRFEHMINVFWNRHIIHHSSEEFNLACALRQSVSGTFAIFTFLYIPMAIVGVPTEVIAVVAPIHLFAQFWYHTTLIKRMSFLEYIIVTPSHHRVHHAINDEYIDKNFSQIFIVWDKLFGTFQEELEDVPAVYGVKKPVETWNPFLINFMHIFQIAKDAIRTEKLWDKIRIWFMPTGWRPKDMQEKYPIKITKNPYTRVKYDTPASVPFQVWHWIQLVIVSALMLYVFNQLGSFQFVDVLLCGGFLAWTIFSYTTLMDRNPHAVWMEAIKVVFGIALIYKMSGWYNLDQFIPYGTYLIVAYLLISFAVTLGYVLDFRKKETVVEMQMA